MVMAQDDETTSLNEVKKWVQDFCEERDWDPYHGPKDLAIGLVTEASELLELFRFVPEKDLPELMRKPSVRANAADELADSLYFILRFAQLYGFDLSECLRQKMKKNAVKYPAPLK
ncbi:MAG: nucleotide pyrophosphohydrolase [Bdellovibrionales bacterium]